VLADELRPAAGVARRRRLRQDDRRARPERAEDVEDRQVEAQRRDPEDAIAVGDLEAADAVVDRVGRGAVLDHHALRLAGRAGGEDHVGEVVRLDRRAHRRVRDLAPRGVVVHHQQLDAVREPQPLLHVRLGERDPALPALDELRQPPLGQARVDGQVRRARPHDPEHRRDLLPAVLHDHGDELVRLRAELLEAVRDLVRARVELAVGDGAIAGQHRGCVRPLRGPALDSGVDEALGDRRLGVVRAPAVAQLPGREQLARGHDVLAARDPLEQRLVAGEHRVQHPLREQVLDRVEDQLEAPGALVGLVVEVHLGRLRDAVGDVPEHLGQRRVGVVERGFRDAREDDRRDEAGGADPPRELALHGHAREQPVVEVGGDAALDAHRLLGEGLRAAQVHLEGHRGGEVAGDVVDVGHERQAVADGQVQQEVRARAPDRQHLRERRGEHRRRRDLQLACVGVEGGRCLLVEDHLAALVAAVGLAGRAGERQLGAGRQVREPVHPVGAGALIRIRLLDVAARVQVVLEAGEVGAVLADAEVDVRPVAEDEHDALGVEDQQVDADVQARDALVDPAGADLEQRPAVGLEHLVAELLAHGLEAGVALVGRQRGEVLEGDLVGLDRLEHLLAAVGQDDRAHHAVPVDRGPERVLEARHVGVGHVELVEGVRGEAAELEGAAAAHEVGLLDRGERERLVRVDAPLLGRGLLHRDGGGGLARADQLVERLEELGRRGPGEQVLDGDLDAEPRLERDLQLGDLERLEMERLVELERRARDAVTQRMPLEKELPDLRALASGYRSVPLLQHSSASRVDHRGGSTAPGLGSYRSGNFPKRGLLSGREPSRGRSPRPPEPRPPRRRSARSGRPGGGASRRARRPPTAPRTRAPRSPRATARRPSP
jgi:hypothetical protein